MHASDPTFPLFPILSFLAFIVSFIPFPWHFKARNVGTCSYMLSTGLASLVAFVNSIVWADNVNNVSPFWCDISAQVIIGSNIGLVTSTLVISRQLYNISITHAPSKTPQEKRRDMILNWFIAFGIPFLVMLLHFVVQPRRFDIFEEIGCQPATFNTVAAYILYFMWPVLIGICSFVYSVLTLRNFYIHRLQFAKVTNTAAGMSPSRYIRLMLLVFVDMICNTPIGAFIIIASARETVFPFATLSKTVDFSKVEFVPASEWKANNLNRAVVELNHWVPVFCSFVFFAFFGLAEEAKKNYRKWYDGVKKLFGKGKEADTPLKPRSKMWSMISSNARSDSVTLAPSTKSRLSANDKYVPDDSYLSSTESAPPSPYSPPSCASSLRPLLVGTGSKTPSRQSSIADHSVRAGYLGRAQIQSISEQPPRRPHVDSSISAATSVTLDPSALENGYNRSGQGRPGTDTHGLEDIPLDWSPVKSSS